MSDLPEPFVAVVDKSTAGYESWESLSYYTATQMREYRNAALEEALNVITPNGTPMEIAAAIRALKGN